MKYRITRNTEDKNSSYRVLHHSGVAGMKWGYSDGQTNGKRKASDIAKDVIAGKFGTGQARIDALKKAGYDPNEIENIVYGVQNGVGNAEQVTAALQALKDKGLAGTANTTPQASTATDPKMDSVANDVIKGKYGNGADRIAALTAAGYSYNDVQKLVNEKIKSGSKTSSTSSKSTDTSKTTDNSRSTETKNKTSISENHINSAKTTKVSTIQPSQNAAGKKYTDNFIDKSINELSKKVNSFVDKIESLFSR